MRKYSKIIHILSKYTLRRKFPTTRRCFNSNINVPTSSGILTAQKPLKLISGSTLSPNDIQIHYATWGNRSNPIILIAPSMSNSCFVTAHPDLPNTTFHGGLWWSKLVGAGTTFPIDINKYHVISITPLGSPFGSTSCLTTNSNTGQIFDKDFPIITPSDQARFIRLGLDILGINEELYCIIGGSMGGMQVLEYAAQFPSTYNRLCAIATTGWTSPSTVALRSIQRKIVRLDPKYIHAYHEPLEGLKVTRMIGTICYRSRTEFDDRFKWDPIALEDDPKNETNTRRFEVEQYLEHQGNKFAGYYDANCYLCLSYCMDRMNLGYGFDSFEDGVLRIPNEKDIMLIAYDTDYLIPPKELETLSAILGKRIKSRVYYECVQSVYGHDSFLVNYEMKQLSYRLKAFLDDGVNEVENVVNRELSGL